MLFGTVSLSHFLGGCFHYLVKGHLDVLQAQVVGCKHADVHKRQRQDLLGDVPAELVRGDGREQGKAFFLCVCVGQRR